jgi:hypothetical protein
MLPTANRTPATMTFMDRVRLVHIERIAWSGLSTTRS